MKSKQCPNVQSAKIREREMIRMALCALRNTLCPLRLNNPTSEWHIPSIKPKTRP